MRAIEASFELGLKIVNKIKETQFENIEEASQLIAKAHENGCTFFVSGSGHSHSVSEELYGRAGSLAFTVPIITDELTLTSHPTKSSYIENLSGYAEILGKLYKISEGDVILIASNSGRNNYPVELACYAKKCGAKVIALTSLNHSRNTEPRNSINKRLYEISDVVIDNCGEKGDAGLQIVNVSGKVNPTSSIANSFICGALSSRIVEILAEDGYDNETFVSANVDGGFEQNAALMDKYCRMYYK